MKVEDGITHFDCDLEKSDTLNLFKFYEGIQDGPTKVGASQIDESAQVQVSFEIGSS